MAGAIGTEVMQNIYRGHVPGRSGEIYLVPKPHRYLSGDWDLTTLDTDTPWMNTTHPNPWSYISKVPMIFYGPSVPEGLEVTRPVDVAGIAPSYAELLGMDGFESEAEPLREAFGNAGDDPPKVIFTVVIDGGGWNVLEQHPTSHPTIDALRKSGTTYVNATIGSAPSITGAIHATLSTGFYPRDHGIPGNQMRDPEVQGASGDVTIDTWLQDADPRYLNLPTVSELWDELNGNEPIVATVSYEGWHLGMIGHGAQRPGGDKDIAAIWESESNEWWINESFYSLPDYLQTTDLATLEKYETELDARDGLLDGTWFGKTLEEIRQDPIRPGTTAFVKFTGDAVADVLENEDIGKDDVTDLVWVELKPPDFGGHLWNMIGPEQADTLRETDRQIERFKTILDRRVGEGNYVLAVTADHGQQPLPEQLGGWRINTNELVRDIEDRFGDGIVADRNSVELFLDLEMVEEQDVDLSEIASYIGAYTVKENLPDNRPGLDRVPAARLDERLFAGAFTTDFLESLSADDIGEFGDGEYVEGRLSESATGSSAEGP
jgi:predicted AlkP superfamily pyrophosphatase or phosphodiesterase